MSHEPFPSVKCFQIGQAGQRVTSLTGVYLQLQFAPAPSSREARSDR